jgi:hypothetical protein
MICGNATIDCALGSIWCARARGGFCEQMLALWMDECLCQGSMASAIVSSWTSAGQHDGLCRSRRISARQTLDDKDVNNSASWSVRVRAITMEYVI